MALIVLNWAFSGLGSQPLLQLTFQSYIVDCVKTEERSPTFALLGGLESQLLSTDHHLLRLASVFPVWTLQAAPHSPDLPSLP